MSAKPDRRPPPEDACPALCDELAWRDARWTPGPILDDERMAVHAAELAASLGTPVHARGPGPLRARFGAVRRALSKAYAGLAARERPHEAVPAEEWLLDNAHIVEEQVREIDDDLPRGYLVELPRIRSGHMAGYPRVYVACLDYIRHTDARLDPESLVSYVTAFQSRGSLTIGELWAVPIMLRVGLLIVVGRVAVAVATDQTKVRAAYWTDKLLRDPDRVVLTLAELERDSGDPALLVELLRLLRDRDATPSTIEWIRSQAASFGATTEELGRRVHLQRAADQLSIANAITSMRTIGTYEWRKFFERTSRVEQMLRRDRDGIYGATDRTSRDRCRRALERIARQSGFDEARVARAALDLAARHRDGARAYVGYYFEQSGRRELERACGARLSPCEWVARTVVEHPRAFYFSSFLGLIAALSLLLWTEARRAGFDPGLAAVLALSLLLGASEIALSVLGAAVVALLPPRLLSRLSVEEGIAPEHRTMVVVPVLLDSIPTVDRLIEDLEIRALANPDPNLHFALLSDFCDTNTEAKKDDEPILARAVAAIAMLNERRPLPSGLPKFSLFHRKRVRNDAQGCFMGWERKRGKLEELNRLILGGSNTTFEVVTAPTDLVRSIRYVITLDADTELPRAAAMKLVATIAHPINRPVLDSSGSIVVEGYAVIQPRVGTVPASSRRSVYARISAGQSGLDPYTTAVSDVYQDLFGEGSYIGKAIYDVQAFASVHRNRVSDNRLLSHDLFEGIFARTALASDIELLDDQPSSYTVVANRTHRWIRGDWQLLPFLGRRVVAADGRLRPNDLPSLGFWKILDNLRRSLLAPSLVGVLFLGCLAWPARAGTTVAFEALVLATPLALSSFSGLMRSARSGGGPESVWDGVKRGAAQAAMTLLVLFDQAVLAVDAIARTLYRLVVSKRRLLEWQSTGLDKAGAGAPRRMWVEVPVLAAAAAWVALQGGRIEVCAPVVACWMLAPAIVGWLSRPARAIDPASRLSSDDKQALRTTARKTWQYFETFVLAEEHWLPPDNFQEEPRAVVAHRTSPTNIGLYLLSTISARDFGYIGTRELLRRLQDTIGTLEVLERAEGHILNWYDTKTCKPLEPRYVSTVDSGNLAAYLWTVRQACEEMIHRPMVGPEAVDAVVDALTIARGKPKVAALRPRDGGGARTDHASEPDEVVRDLEALRAMTRTRRKDMWRDVAERTRLGWLEEADVLAPHLAWLRSAPAALSTAPWFASFRAGLTTGLTPCAVQAAGPLLRQTCLEREGATSDPSERAWWHELSVRVESAVQACGSLVQGLRLVGQRAQALADAMNFAFLFDADRSLFSIGYDVATARLDASRYDLLATEARLASLLAIAKGDVPERHWFHLGRARCQVGLRRALLSWSGSMFEYLMPLLVMKSYPDTLLGETHAAVVEAHRTDARKHGVPWGASEAAYNVMDLSMTYQYRAFGAPKLGLRPGLEEDLVIAPYATALASMVRPDLAVDNLRALARQGLDGAFGCYDSIDYTPSRRPPGRRGVVVKAYMAHHQGMTLVALGNALLGAPMQRRFHSDARVRATELLLEERVPAAAPVLAPQPRRPPVPVAAGEDLGALEHVGLEEQGALRTHLLGHGELTTIITSAGTGVTMWRGLDLVRFREDGRLDPSGTFVYIRNRSTGQSWSTGFEPSRVTPSSYRVTFSVDHVEIHRRDGDIETTTEVVASPEHCVEVRRITLINHGKHACEVDLTSYAEVVLCPRSADVAHRAFENMFIEFEEDATLGALLVTRRDRASGALCPWLVQMLSAESHGWNPVRCDSSRPRFVGRGRDLTSPEGLWSDAPSKVAKHPLDPAAILRRSVVIEPQATARIALVTGVAPSRAEVVDLAHRYVSSTHVDRAFELAWADARVELNHLRIGAAQSFRFQRLLSFILDPQKPLRAAADSFAARGDGRGALWAHGISGDLPIVVLRIDDGVVGAVCGELLLAHEFFRLNNFAIDLVFWNEEPAGYLQPLQDQLIAVIQAGFAQGYLDKRGGVFVKRANQIDERQRGLVLGAARVVLRTSAGSLARQLRLAGEEAAPSRPLRQKVAVTKPATAPRLVFDNGAVSTRSRSPGQSSQGPGIPSALAARSTRPRRTCSKRGRP